MQITINLTDNEVKYLQNDLLDINQWVQDAVKGKINNCKKRLIKSWQPILLADAEVETIPATEDGMLSVIIAHKDYKNRAERDEAAE